MASTGMRVLVGMMVGDGSDSSVGFVISEEGSEGGERGEGRQK